MFYGAQSPYVGLALAKLRCLRYSSTWPSPPSPRTIEEYRGSCLVLALNPGSILLVASTTSSIESCCVVVSVWKSKRMFAFGITEKQWPPLQEKNAWRFYALPSGTANTTVRIRQHRLLLVTGFGGRNASLELHPRCWWRSDIGQRNALAIY